MNAAAVTTTVLAMLFFISAPDQEQSVMGNNCMKTMKIERGESPWQGMTGSAAEEKASMGVSAISYDPAIHDGFAHLEKFNAGGEPLLFRARGKKIVGVSAKYFSNLQRADATRIGGDSRIGIGNVRVAAFSSITPETLARFLVESQLIITYWHIGSELCLEKETASRTEYIAWFTGSHTYFTNEKNVDPLRFAVRIDLVSGAMTVMGH